MAKNNPQKYHNNTLIYSLTSKYIFDTIKVMRYTYAQFKSEYPTDDACLDAVFQNRFGDIKFCPKCAAETKFYRVKKRQCYACMHCGYQLHPLAGTIFRKSSTPLTNWFHAIYLFSVAKNGVSAKELERHLGVTYKTAWRMAKQIRLLMEQDDDKFSGTVEADETYIGGRGSLDNWRKKKSVVIGITDKNGGAKAKVADGINASNMLPFIRANVETGSVIHTDESPIYSRVKWEFEHYHVNHAIKEYVNKHGVHTNTIEGFWSQMKRSIGGTYHCVSPKYLQSYVNEFVFRYNFRDVAVCPVLLERAAKLS